MAHRKALQIPVQPWFRDHHFNGEAIFPAVESMLLLAGMAQEIRADIPIQLMTDASFSKLLTIPEEITEFPALVEYDTDEKENSLCLKLLTKQQLKKISRIREHAKICFPAEPFALEPVTQITATENDTCITAERIYRELVPFGPCYRSLTGLLSLSDQGARGTLQAPKLSAQHRMETTIGSPFPLDGAMHAACVLGQCIADFVPFPVGFAKRIIHRPTQPGEHYSTTVRLQAATQDELLFDLSIFDSSETPCETVTGLRMRDVSRGTIRPSADLPRIEISQQLPG